MDIISMDSRLFDTRLQRMKTIDEKVTTLCIQGEDLMLKHWLDNQEVCQILGITQRTLQTYRNIRIAAIYLHSPQNLLQTRRCGESFTESLSHTKRRIMQNYLRGQQEPCIADWLERMEKTEKALDRQLKKVAANRVFGGERFLSDVQLSQRWHISRRTLQDYRSAGALPYYLVSGKVIYKESDIQRMLEKAYRPSFDRRNLL